MDIIMPKMGESITEGTIIKWHKQAGDFIKKDEILFEISTDKVDTEIPSEFEGYLQEILVKENETAEVGTVVARISNVGSVAEEKSTGTAPSEIIVESGNKNQAAESTHGEEGQNKFYSPSVLNIIRRNDISFREIENLKGSGTGGRITRNDILSYIASKNNAGIEKGIREDKAEAQIQNTAVNLNSRPSGRIEIIPMDNIRRNIMKNMVESRDTSVHVTGMIEVDVSKIYNYLKTNKEKIRSREGINLTYMAFISYAAVKALKEYPIVNASVEGTNIIIKKYINLGIAVALEPNGLIVPNIKDADSKNIFGLAKSITEIAEKARTKKLKPEDVSDGTFSITNYGRFGSIFGTPIINQPEAAILGAGAIVKRPVVIENDGEDMIAVRPVLTLTLSHDHRLIDGMAGGRFLKHIKDTLENFDTKNM
jgi:2-oxoglutarate dehydrogenase E2 component (dihydrolipoamide succinyltransferase)